MSSNILVIGDPHAHPDYDNARFSWLGEYLAEVQPEFVVCMGDFADMPSLSSYDKGTRGFEGRRYDKDVAATHDALSRLQAPLLRLRKARATSHRRRYSPRLLMALGNHEDRIDRLTACTPEMHGKVSVDDLGYRGFGWTQYGYRESFSVLGIHFCHHFASGVAGRPIGGERVATSLLSKLHASAVVGHNHILDFAERTQPDGAKLFGLSAGCFSHAGQVEGWNRDTQHLWWRGVVLLRDVADGYPQGGVTTTTMTALEKRYG